MDNDLFSVVKPKGRGDAVLRRLHVLDDPDRIGGYDALGGSRGPKLVETTNPIQM
jgi:hypothetical protein